MIRIREKGFTLIELLIVMAIIGILAGLSMAALGGIQQRGRDAQRKNDLANIAKALDLYYNDHNQYPPIGWVATNNSNWSQLATYLVPNYISKLPVDPKNTAGTNSWSADISGNYTDGFIYEYNGIDGRCGGVGQKYFLVTALENKNDPQGGKNITVDCVQNWPQSDTGSSPPNNFYGVGS